MASLRSLRKRKLPADEEFDIVSKSTDAERASRYRMNIKKDARKYENYKEKERVRKRKQRKERTKEQIIKDNLKSKERQKRYRERQKEKGIKQDQSKKPSKILTRKEREKLREYWRVKKNESRKKQTSQKKRRIREKNVKYWHLKTTEKLLKKQKQKTRNGISVQAQTSKVLQSLVQEDKILKKKLIYRLSFLKKYGLNKQLAKYTGIRPSEISKGSKVKDFIRKRRRDATSDNVKKTIQDFMKRVDVSTNLPVTKRVKKDNEERRVLNRPMKSLFSEFQRSYPDIDVSLSTFKRNKPKSVETTKKQRWEGCLCELCTNVDLKLQAITKLASRKKSNACMNLKCKYDAVSFTMCEKEGEYNKKECILRQCANCGVKNIISHFNQLAEQCVQDDSLSYTKWERVNKNAKGKEVMRVVPVSKQATFAQIVTELSEELENLAEHLFVAKWQQKQFTELQHGVPEGWVILNMDFAENYSCVSQNEVQSAHWGHEQVTVHPTVAYYKCTEDGCDKVVIESLIFISSDRTHDAHAVHEFTKIANKHLTEKRGLSIQKEIHMTDGCSAQYKSNTPFADISCSHLDYGFPTERHFYGSRHGKGPSDGAGAVVKSFVRRGVLGSNVVVNNAEEFYDYATKLTKNDEHSKRTLFLVKEINRNRPDRSDKKTVSGTRKLQCVKTVKKNQISTRNLSCFCSACKEEKDGCENSELVENWKIQDLETVGVPKGLTGGRQRIRTRGGRGGRGSCRTRSRGTRGVRTRGGRGRGRGILRQCEDSSSDEGLSSSDEEESSSDHESTKAQEKSFERDEREEFSDLENIGHISGLSDLIIEAIQEDDEAMSPIIQVQDHEYDACQSHSAVLEIPEVLWDNIRFLSTEQVIETSDNRMVQEIETSDNRILQEIETSDNRMVQEIETSDNRILQEIETSDNRMVQEIETRDNRMVQEIETRDNRMVQEIETRDNRMVQEIETRDNRMVQEIETRDNRILQEIETSDNRILQEIETSDNRMVQEIETRDNRMVQEIETRDNRMVQEIETRDNRMVQEIETRDNRILQEIETSDNRMVQEIETSDNRILQEIETSDNRMVQEIETRDNRMVQEIETRDNRILQEIETSDNRMVQEIETRDNRILQEIEASDNRMAQEIETRDNRMVQEIETSDNRMVQEIQTSYNTGQFLRIAHGKDIYPAVVDTWPKVVFFAKKKKGWVEGTIIHEAILSDVTKVLQPPDIKMIGSRIFYSFKDL